MLNIKALLCISTVLLLAVTAKADEDLRDRLSSIDRTDRVTLGGQDYLRIEARANTFTSSSQVSPSLTFLDDSSVIVAWESRRQEEGSYGVYAQRFNAVGKRTGGEVHLNTTERSTQWKPGVAVAGNGDVWCGWESFLQDGSRFGCLARKFDAALEPKSGEVLVDTDGYGDQVALRMVPRKEGGFFALWTGPGGEGYRSKAMMRCFDAQGEAEGPALLLDECTALEERLVCAEALPQGGFVAVWPAMDQEWKPAGIRARFFDERGAALGEPSWIAEGRGLEPDVATLPGGGFAAAWLEAGADRYAVRVQRFDAEGHAAAPAFTAGLSDGGAAVASDADGRLLVAWNDENDIRARSFLPGGEPAGDAFRVNGYMEGKHALNACTGKRRVAMGPRGQMAFAWSGNAGLGDHSAVHLTLLLPVPRGIRGDLDGNRLVDERDGELLIDLLTGKNVDPILYAAADVDGSGKVDTRDLERVPCHDLERIEVFEAALASAQERLKAEKAALKAARAKARSEAPSLVMLSEYAKPYEPPKKDKLLKPEDPFGGDPEPMSFAGDFGFAAVTNTGWTPPDPHLAVGPDHIVTMTNGAIAFFGKDGTMTFQDEIEDSYGFWGSLGATNFVFDPEVIYDPHANRFMAMANERGSSGGSFYLLAVSAGTDPNGFWYKYRFDVTALAGGDIDSPNIAVDQDVVYLTADFFTGGQKYLIYMLEKAPLLTGAAPGIVNHILIQGSQSYGIPVTYGTPPAMYMIEHFEDTTNNQVQLHAITDPLGTPQHQKFMLTVPSYSPPESAPQMGSSVEMTTFDSRFWSCVYRNGHLWAAHHQGSSLVKARWYEIDMANWPISGTPSLVQSGDVAPGINVRTYFNSISVDEHDNALMVFARSGPTEYISVCRAYRKADDPLGTMPNIEIAKVSNGPYTYYSRWGDYSAVGVDPSDNTRFWYTHEYAPSSSSWNTWIGSKRVHEGALSVDVETMSESTGGTATFTLTNPSHASKRYLLLGTFSGTSPGTPLPPNPGGVVLPINWDAFTDLILVNLGPPYFSDFLGTLDGNGEATAVFWAPALPHAAGFTMHFAFCQDGSWWDFASNAVDILVVP
jgi:hypothetical protein